MIGKRAIGAPLAADVATVSGRSRLVAVALVAMLLSLACVPPAMADQQVGSAAVVVNNVTGTIASTQQRSALLAGIDVFQNEIIDTADGSASRVVFQDKTDLQIGPSSRVTLDRFVYNPDPSQSQVALSVVRGVARFTSGVLPKPNYALRTPSASIGVRGTALTITVSPAKLSTISVESGVATVTAQGVTVTVPAGYSTQVPFGSPPSQPYPTPASPAVMQMDTLLASAPVAPPSGTLPLAGLLPNPLWTGPYIGIDGGWADSGHRTITNTASDNVTTGVQSLVASGRLGTTARLGLSGGVGGGTLGHNWQVDPLWVAGVEINVGGVSASSRTSMTTPPFTPPALTNFVLPLPGFTVGYTRSQSVLTTARARAGFLPMPNLMLFVTGGIAVGENRFSTSFNCPACGPGSLTPSTTSTHTVFGAGPAGGAGLEWMVLPNVSIKAEYLYVNLASLDSALIFNPSTANMGVLRSTVDNGEHVVRFGINYHFGAPTPLP